MICRSLAEVRRYEFDGLISERNKKKLEKEKGKKKIVVKETNPGKYGYLKSFKHFVYFLSYCTMFYNCCRKCLLTR